MAVKETRKPPVHRQRVTVKGKAYDVLTSLVDPNWPVLVASGSQDGYWIVWREEGAFRCACPSHLFRGRCSHAEAAVQADTALFPADVWPGPGEVESLDAWLDGIGEAPPDDDERYEIEDGPHLLDLMVERRR